MTDCFTDKRGEIKDLIAFLKEDIAVTRIRSFKGAVRGNHYHKRTEQWTYIVKGLTRVVCTSAATELVYDYTALPGDLVHHEVNSKHAFEALEDTEWIVITQGPRKGEDYESDTFRLDVPLIQNATTVNSLPDAK